VGAYEVIPERADKSPIRLVENGKLHENKVEGGEELCPAIKGITQVGIPVAAHVCLTPQRQSTSGGFRVQRKIPTDALRLTHDTKSLREAGAFMLVLEASHPELLPC
jgi:3-methyl-2-oxobutanoate hydroxymethyltransferase